MRIAAVIGYINTRILLILVFYLIIAPMGMMMRLFGKDIAGLKIDKKRPTYWIKRPQGKVDPAQYEKQF